MFFNDTVLRIASVPIEWNRIEHLPRYPCHMLRHCCLAQKKSEPGRFRGKTDSELLLLLLAGAKN
jgi:hypothetical protein